MTQADTNRGHRRPVSYAQTKVRLQVMLFAAVAVVMLAILIYRVARGEVDVGQAALALAVGLALGAVGARIFRLEWNESTQTVVSHLDVLGAVILVLYILINVLKVRVIESWGYEQEIASTLGLGVSGGAMLGRVIFTVRGVRSVLAAIGIR